jgi:hypothetical protein
MAQRLIETFETVQHRLEVSREGGWTNDDNAALLMRVLKSGYVTRSCLSQLH